MTETRQKPPGGSPGGETLPMQDAIRESEFRFPFPVLPPEESRSPPWAYPPSESPRSESSEQRPKSSKSEDQPPQSNPQSPPISPGRDDGSSIGSPVSNPSDDYLGPVPMFPIPNLPRPGGSFGGFSFRRGFSKSPGVAPIPEENERHWGKESYASSRALPSSWGSGVTIDVASTVGSHNDAREEHNNLENEGGGIVQRASVAKRRKPTLRSISITSIRESREPDSEQEHGNESQIGVAYTTTDTVTETSHAHDSASASTEDDDDDDGTSEGAGHGSDGATATDTGSSTAHEQLSEKDNSANGANTSQPRGERMTTSSLPELIRRAGKLAADLEKGRTASEVFEASQDSTITASRASSGSLSYILASFPPPRNDTPAGFMRSSWPFFTSKGRVRGSGSVGSRDDYDDSTDKPQKRYCGMSRTVLIIVCVLAVAIIAAAVIIPVALVVLPQNQNPCKHGGISVDIDGVCGCMCLDGFSGELCEIATDAECNTMDTGTGLNATIGKALPRLFTRAAEPDFDIPLDKMAVLEALGAHKATCAYQNSLVSFRGSSQKLRRDLLLSPLNDDDDDDDVLPSPAVTTAPRWKVKRDDDDDDDQESSVLTINGIILDGSGTTETSTKSATSPSTSSATLSSSSSSASSPPLSSSSSTPTPTPTSPNNQGSTSLSEAEKDILDFARVAVLFVLQETGDIKIAAIAQRDIASFLAVALFSNEDNNNNNNNRRPLLSGPNARMNVTGSPEEFADGDCLFTLDFETFSITMANGTVVGD